MVLPALLDDNALYETNQTLLLEPTTSKASPILKARVVINYTLVVIRLLIANISSAPVTIEKGEMPAVDKHLEQHSFSEEPAELHGNKKTLVQEACDRADPALTKEQKSALFALLKTYSEAFSLSVENLGRKNLIYHTLDIGDSGPVRQGMRRIPYEQIKVLKAEVDILQSARMVEPSYSLFASPTILVKMMDGSWRLCIDYHKLNSVKNKDAHPLPRVKNYSILSLVHSVSRRSIWQWDRIRSNCTLMTGR